MQRVVSLFLILLRLKAPHTIDSTTFSPTPPAAVVD